MKILKWFKEGAPIPEGAVFLNHKKHVTTKEDHDDHGYYEAEGHDVWLYEVPFLGVGADR